MKLKSSCQRCGRIVAKSKLHKSFKSSDTLCSFCYSKENRNRFKFKLQTPQIIPATSNNMYRNQIKRIEPTLLRGESDYLYSRHRDKVRIDNLKMILKENNKKAKDAMHENVLKSNANLELNKKFIMGLD